MSIRYTMKCGILSTFLFTAAMVLGAGAPALAAQYIKFQPMAEAISTPVGAVVQSDSDRVPLITWGGDIATIVANGNAMTTVPGSSMDRKGLSITLYREDRFVKQVEAFMSGKTPYLRGTLGMIESAREVLCKDARTCPEYVYQMTYSAGGDALVVREDIKKVADLKGKTIVLQAYGPHTDFLTQVLGDAGLSPGDVTLKWVEDLTGSDNAPMAALQSDVAVDAVFVISPDAAALTHGGSGVGDSLSVKTVL